MFSGFFRYCFREEEALLGPKRPLCKKQKSICKKSLHVTTWEARREIFAARPWQSIVSS
jgi:hypothetical protein